VVEPQAAMKGWLRSRTTSLASGPRRRKPIGLVEVIAWREHRWSYLCGALSFLQQVLKAKLEISWRKSATYKLMI
jgi:hypothetical protein